MTLNTEQRAMAARLLRDAEHHIAPIEPLSSLLPGLDLSDAYAIQRDNIARRLADGASVVGHKIGLTSAAMQQLLGVGEPDFGHLLNDMVHRDGAPVFAGQYCRPRIEPEICFRLARPLLGPAITVQDVLDATDAVAPALEIADSRIQDWKITLVDTVADNASSAGLICGPWMALADSPDLASVTVDLLVDGACVASGRGREVLGHPAAAVAWLANTLAAFSTSLAPGEIVLPGAMTEAPFVTAGQGVEARFSGLRPVSASFV
ncbi:2-keto-4-pentenoate hydratase [Streptomyces deccanensis]|uniref:2-keto-4-pentenoate hydratase n=1 Tax=Streptomyces deccanensis TaxID=424188 RepID=UPI001EFAB096|nr:fumarylacetoacetate hydrolase family protein [Streptomyces deccanensis]ULR48542.1 fumarylacetoacetate hydrolase family protein [Streptomyces deccanensis]